MRKYAQDPLSLTTEPEKQDGPDEAKMVEEVEDQPIAHWREYLQPIIRALKAQLGAQISLINPELSNDYMAPQFGFNITGYLKFPKGRPEDLKKTVGDDPIRFEVHVGPPDNDIHYPIELYHNNELVSL